MSLWEKIKSGLEEGLETLSEKSVEVSNLIKLKWERRTIQKEIHSELGLLGEIVFQLHGTGKTVELPQQVKENILKLKDLESQLNQKEEEIEDLATKIDHKQIKGLKKDLEMGDGTIEQIIIQDDSNLIGKKLMEIKFPKNVLIGTIVRNERVIIPDGKTLLKGGDRVTLLGKKEDVDVALNQLG